MKILLMTGFANERQRAHNLEALIHRVIAKPFTLEEICSAVDEELDALTPRRISARSATRLSSTSGAAAQRPLLLGRQARLDRPR